MREIKFRAKSLDGTWVYGELHLRSMHPHMHTISGIKHINENTVGQFTGLHDKNGKEIYEGDFLDVTVFDCFDRDRQYRVLVEWVGSEFIGITNDDDAWNLGWLCSQDEEIEVIGNVYDNPELQKGGEK